jgi:acetyltransferase EpsM
MPSGSAEREPVVIWGASGHARVVADALRAGGRYEVAGYVDDLSPGRRGETFCGAPVLGGREVLGELAGAGVRRVFVAVGDCGARLRLAGLLRDAGLELVVARHPSAVVAPDVRVGMGTLIAAGAVINPGSVIGENVIVNTAASVDHDCVLADGVHLSPGARLAGGVAVGRGAWVGIGAVLIDKVTIGEGAIVGAGAVVLRDVPPGAVAYGVPARVVRQREERDA